VASDRSIDSDWLHLSCSKHVTLGANLLLLILLDTAWHTSVNYYLNQFYQNMIDKELEIHPVSEEATEYLNTIESEY